MPKLNKNITIKSKNNTGKLDDPQICWFKLAQKKTKIHANIIE